MNWFKKFICRIFKIKTYMSEYNQYKSMYENVQKNYNLTLAIVDTYKLDLAEANEKIAELNKLSADPIAYVDEQMSKAIEKYETCANELEELANKQEQLKHKYIAEGRQIAYSEMGIWRLDAIKDGNCLVMDKEGNIFELLQNLEDIKETITDDVEDVIEDKIEIEDLV